MKKQASFFDKLTQWMIPILTVATFLFTSLKKPEIGLLFSLASQPFWFYSGWRAWKEAGQIGIFLTTAAVCSIVLYGVVNYWIL